MSDLVLAFALIATLLIGATLVSGLVERSPLTFPLIFLGLGLVLGEVGLGVIKTGPDDLILEVVATLTLSLVLFLDAVNIEVDELGKRWLVPALILGPGTALIIALGALPFALLLGFSWTVAFIGGAVLASTDPVMLREIVRDERIPRSIRQVLKIEAGTNDMVILPVVLMLIAVARAQVGDTVQWPLFLGRLLLLGPAIGFAVGGIGSWVMGRVDSHWGIRREYQAVYGLGLVLAAYASSTASGGDGFLGAFSAGLAVVLLNQRLCDCFLEYGEVTSEMAMLLAFVLFGAVLSSILGTIAIGATLLTAGLVIFVIRPSVLGLLLLRSKMSWEANAFVSWFGPRGLNSLLLVLLAVQAEVGNSELLLAAVGVVVLASVTIHGATAAPFTAWYARRASKKTLAEEREGTAPGLFGRDEAEVRRITPEELNALLARPDSPIVLDVRSRSDYERDGAQIPGSVRVPPDHATEWAIDQANDRPIVAYCN